MRMFRFAAGVAAASIAVLGFTGCALADSGPGDSPSVTASDSPADTPSGEPDASGASLARAESEFGTIVVDGEGMTVYQFDNDTRGSGSSTCTGRCAVDWPAVPGGDEAPEVDGVTGEVDTITGADGEPQLALNGWPLYYYAGDTAPGDINGQGVNRVWWVLTPDGERITDAAGPGDDDDGEGGSAY